jgi:hypothetical protein
MRNRPGSKSRRPQAITNPSGVSTRSPVTADRRVETTTLASEQTALAERHLPPRAETAAYVLVAVAVIAVFALSKGPIDVDDAYIGYRYAQNFASGLGLVYNPGEHVFGVTNVLWTLLLGTFSRITQATVENVASIFSLVLLISTAIASYAFARKIGVSPAVRLLLVVSILASPSFLLVSTMGMETPLYCFLILSAGAAISFDKRLLAGVCAGLAFATRPDGLAVLPAVVMVMAVEATLHERQFDLKWIRSTLPVLSGFAIAAVPHLIFCYTQFGQLLPHTLRAKRALPFMSSRWWMPLHFLKGPGIPVVLFSTAGVYFLVRLWRKHKMPRLSFPLRAFVFCFSWLMVYATAWTIVRIDLYPWYIGAMGPASAALVVTVVAIALTEEHPANLRIGFATVAVMIGAWWTWSAMKDIRLFRLYQLQMEEPRKRLALAIRSATTSDLETVGAGPIGILGYFCGGCRITDYSGLVTTPETRAAALPETFLMSTVGMDDPPPASMKPVFETGSPLPGPDLLLLATDPARTSWNSSVLSPEIKLNAAFGKTVHLIGVTPVSREVKRGELVSVQSLWRFDQPLPPDRVIAYYLGNGKTPNLAYIDTKDFFKGKVPHAAIAPGESVCDFETLQMPPNAEPGDYELSVIVYPPAGFECSSPMRSKVRPGLVRLYDVHLVAD